MLRYELNFMKNMENEKHVGGIFTISWFADIW